MGSPVKPTNVQLQQLLMKGFSLFAVGQAPVKRTKANGCSGDRTSLACDNISSFIRTDITQSQTWGEAGFGFTKRAFQGQGFGFGFLDFWEPGFGFVIFKGFGFVVYRSFDFATNLFKKCVWFPRNSLASAS